MAWRFQEELARFGPGSAFEVTPEESALYCRRLAASHYENFHVITWLTPRHLRPAFAAIYAYCRWSDDLGDEVGDRERACQLLAWWRGELKTVYEGSPRHPVMQALKPVVAEFQIPIEPFRALISAFEQDQEVLEYDSYEQLLDYCERSANPVGRLVLYLFRCMNEETGKLSDATCTALQLANFWQDVTPDLEDRGRIYLPAEDRARFGVSRRDLETRNCTDGFRQLMAFEVERARQLFQQGLPLLEKVPREVALDVDLFSRGGLEILREIERAGYDVLTARPALGKLTKLRLLSRALLGRIPGVIR